MGKSEIEYELRICSWLSMDLYIFSSIHSFQSPSKYGTFQNSNYMFFKMLTIMACHQTFKPIYSVKSRFCNCAFELKYKEILPKCLCSNNSAGSNVHCRRCKVWITLQEVWRGCKNVKVRSVFTWVMKSPSLSASVRWLLLKCSWVLFLLLPGAWKQSLRSPRRKMDTWSLSASKRGSGF